MTEPIKAPPFKAPSWPPRYGPDPHAIDKAGYAAATARTQAALVRIQEALRQVIYDLGEIHAAELAKMAALAPRGER